jgi:hypothetical protein
MTKTVQPFIPQLRTLGSQFRLVGWVGLWLKLILAVISLIIVIFAAISSSSPQQIRYPNPAFPGQNIPFQQYQQFQTGPSVTVGLPLIIVGVVCLALSVYWSFSYTRMARRFLAPTPKMQPTRAETLGRLRFSIITDLIGLLFMVLGSEAIGGILLGKALSQGVGSFINFDPSRLVQPIDLLVILACFHTFAGLFVGLAGSLWLLQLAIMQRPGGSSEPI